MKFLKVIILIVLILIVAVVTASFIARIVFNQKVNTEVQALYSHVDQNSEIVQASDLEGLPEPVQRWLQYSGIVGKEKIYAVRIKQEAEMRLKPDAKWMSVEAEQYFSVEDPGFIWNANIKAAPLISISGRDKYDEGRGNMLIKPLSLFTAGNSTGEEIDQGTLLRYLAETMWFPTAVLSDYITWQEIDDQSAKVTMSYEGVTASGIFSFNDKGEVNHFVAQRYGEFDGEYSMETWSIPVSDYREFEGIKIPTKGKITWELESGDFNWFNFKVTKAEYNKPSPF